MKKLLALVLALTMALLVGVASAETEETTDLSGMKVGLCTATATHGFNAELITHAQNETARKAEEYGFDYNIVTCADSTAQVNAL